MRHCPQAIFDTVLNCAQIQPPIAERVGRLDPYTFGAQWFLIGVEM